MLTVFRKWMLNKIEKQAKETGMPVITIDEKKLAVYGERFSINENWLSRLSDATGFFLSVPPSFYCVVLYPDESLHELEQGFHSALPGEYQPIYVPMHARFLVIKPISEFTKDGRKVSLGCLIEYKVKNPSIALQIEKPIELLDKYVQTDIASYIRAHRHNEITSLIDPPQKELLHSFIKEKHFKRGPLSNAIAITNVEVKISSEKLEEEGSRRINLFELLQIVKKERLERKRELEKLLAEHKAEIERLIAKTSAEQDVLRNEILNQSKSQNTRKENRVQIQWRHDLLLEASDVIGEAIESSSRQKQNSVDIEGILTKLLTTIKGSNNNTSSNQENAEIKGLINALHKAIDNNSTDISFSAYYPKEGIIESWHTLLVYAYIKSAMEKIQEDMEKFGNQIKSPKGTTSKSSTPIARGTELTIVPSCEGVTFNPAHVSFKWLEDFHRTEFRFKADKFLLGDAAKGNIDVYAGPLIVGTLKFAMLFNEKEDAQPIPNHEEYAKMYGKDDVFISYSRKDTDIARTFKTVLESSGLDVFLDVDDIRSGQLWEEELKRRIKQAKIFQIFWSQNYSQSENCKQEWEYALKQNKEEGYIRPVYWNTPLSPKPPEELNKFNFKYVELNTSKDG